MFRYFSETYYWTPQQIADLTIIQINIYLEKVKDDNDPINREGQVMTVEQQKAMHKRQAEERKRNGI